MLHLDALATLHGAAPVAGSTIGLSSVAGWEYFEAKLSDADRAPARDGGAVRAQRDPPVREHVTPEHAPVALATASALRVELVAAEAPESAR